MATSYTKTNWQDAPSTATPITAAQLNRMEKGIGDCSSQGNANELAIAANAEAIQTLESDIQLSKQDKLVSGENIKTINGESVLGSGNIEIQVEVDQTYSPTSANAQSGKAVAEAVSTEQNRANNTFSNALKGSKSGSAFLIDDVSPVTHEMRVKISSDTVTDLTAVKVSRCGKNLFDISQVETTTNLTNNGDGTLTVTGYGSGETLLKSICPALKVGDTCTLTFTTTGAPLIYLLGANIGWNSGKSLTITETMLNSSVLFYCKRVDGVNAEAIVSDIQIELGSTATDYEPYITPTEYTPTADGIVNGVTSLCPSTTLTTDTNGVLIDCEYNRDINKAFAELQQAIISSGGNV